jgi:hypothetical protein
MPPSPVGFFSGKSIWSKTLVASTTDYVELPTDQVIRLIMPCAGQSTEEPDINIDNFKITEDHDRKVIMEMGVLEALQMFESRFPQIVEHHEGRTLAATSVYHYFTPAKDLLLASHPSEDLDNYINYPWSGGQKRYIMGSATTTINTIVTGRCPHGAIPLPMGVLDEPDSWWDVTKLGSARMKLVTGAGDTGAAYELITQSVRKY